MKTRSIRTRIVGLLLALALPLIAIVAFTLLGEYRTNAERAEGAAAELAVATANGVSQVLDDGHAVLEELARDSSILALDAPRCAPWLREVTAMLPQFANIVVTDTMGTVVCSAASMEERPSVQERTWFREVMRTAQPATGTFQIGNITGRPVIVLAHPLIGPDSAVRGVVAAGVDLDRFQRLLEDLPQPPGAVVTLADRQWSVLARSREPERWIGQTLPGDTVPERSVADGVGLMRATGLDGIDRVFGFATLPGAHWRVYAGVPGTWIYAPVRQAVVRRGIAIAAVLAGVTLLTSLLFRRVARSLQELVEGTRAAAEGDGARVPERGPTEVVAIARQFNATLAARDRAEDELRRARERYASVLRNAVSGIFIATADGRFVEVNPALARMLGYPSETALRSVNARLAFADPARFDDLVRQAFGGTRVRGEEIEWRRFDGARVIARLSCGVALTVEGERMLEVIAEDVTDQRALEEHLLTTRKMEAIGRLAGGVAHDFNNLLTIVRGQAQFLLLEMGDGADLRQHAEEIIEATQRGARLTRQLLAFGRRQQVQPVPIDVADIVRNLQPMLRRVTGDDITVLLDLAADTPPASADPGQVEQIVMNLAFNACDAMPNGGQLRFATAGVTLTDADCRGRAGARPGDFVCLAVSDTGGGIPPELMGRVFEPFFTTKPQGQGTGLGLATVYGIVTQSGGWIEVHSTPGGSTFTAFLPRSDEPLVRLPEEPEESDTGVRGTVLVAEDEEAVRRIVVTALRNRGFTVLEAADGEEALDVARHHRGDIDLLVTDEMMPRLRGTQLAGRLIPERSHLRVLFMSGYADKLPSGDVFDGVPSTFLAKPFSPDQLLHSVTRLLRRDQAVGAG